MCDCPQDWIVCFRQDCERGALLKEAAKQAHEAAQKVLGDARVSVEAKRQPMTI